MNPENLEVVSINPTDVSVGAFHAWLLGAIAPRPIAFVSSISAEGEVNLAPFSFFNVFGSNPPLLIFSPSTRVRDATNKHSLINAQQVPEVVVNMVNYPMVEQMSLASCEYPKGVNEFIKAGFTQAASLLVKPPRVAEAPAAFECKVLDVITYGNGGGAANLVICQVVMGHFRKDYLDENGKLDPGSLDLVGRMGGDWYVRATREALFTVPKPNEKKGIGFDNLPKKIIESTVLTGNNLARLANVEEIPAMAEIEDIAIKQEIELITRNIPSNYKEGIIAMQTLARNYIEAGEVAMGWQILLRLPD